MSAVDETINNFISVAERFNGVKEGSSQHNIILNIYNSSKPAGEYTMTAKDPWCAAFVGAIAGGCGLGNIIPVSASCDRMISRFPSMGGKRVNIPQRGDIAFFDWNGDGAYVEHVGIVTEVNGGEVTTIEGNKMDMVSHRKFSNTSALFYRPNWEGKSVQSTETISWSKYREFYQELSWDEKNEIKTFPTLSIGSTGIYVKILQDFIGLYPDGTFGDNTNASLIAYQKKKQLEPDGVCGRQTWSSFFV